MKTLSYAAPSATEDLSLLEILRREVLENDVKIEIEYCGVCHSDIHMARSEWGEVIYPVVPGHEIVGRVSEIGGNVTNFKVGDLVGVGCMVDSCQTCGSCGEGLEQYCENGATLTYGSEDKYLGGQTFGGYSQDIVVDKKFVLSVSEKLDTRAVAPLLCAGITTYSPLKHWKIKKGDKVGVIGLGGLGHMGIKFAHAMGAKVVMITRSTSKGEDAKALGADEVLISTSNEQMQEHMNSFDFLLNTIPVKHDLNPYVMLLKRDATMTIVGAIEPVEPVNGGPLIFGRKRIAGSLIGGIKETQEMLDFCAEHNIVSDVEMIDMDQINVAYERIIKADVKYRFVIDMKSLK
jgi:uncharacterized zinc-type alcohol dehydrogenase-like protein